MKAVNFISRIFKAVLLLLVAVNFSYAQQRENSGLKKKSYKRTYDCKKVGVQKVKSRNFKKGKDSYTVVKAEAQKNQVATDSIKPALNESSVQLYAIAVANEVESVESQYQETHVLPLPQPVYFKFDTDELSFEDLHQIALAIEHLKKGKSIILEGHTDSHGSNVYNMDLSLKRANKIKKMILEIGGPEIKESAISIKYYGEEKPAVANTSVTNRQLNRRVEFIVL